MFKAANKDSSPPTSITPATVGSSCLSSQAATLRVTSEGLNIVGDGGVLGRGKNASNQKEQKQKFFATRSADGNWNLLMASTSDPSRLFLVQPAPGHKFQMTGGKVRMENADTAAENKSADGSSSNGYEEDLSSPLSTPESVELAPGTSKSIAVPVAQLRASSSHPMSSSLTTAAASATATSVETTTATCIRPFHPCNPPDHKKPTFFKSRTSKDREALKASAQHVVGKKVIFMNRKGGKSAGSVQACHSSNGRKKGKSAGTATAGTAKSHKNFSFSSLTSHEHTSGGTNLPDRIPKEVSSFVCVSFSDVATTVSPPLKPSTSVTYSSGSSPVSSSGQVTSVFDSSLNLSPSSSPSRSNMSGTSTPIISSNTDNPPCSTPQSHTEETPHCRNSSTGDEDFQNTASSDTEKKLVGDQQSNVMGEDGVCSSAGEGECEGDNVGIFDSLVEKLSSNEDSATRKSSEYHDGSEDAQIAGESSNLISTCLQSPSELADSQELCSVVSHSQMDKSPEKETTVSLQNDESVSISPIVGAAEKDSATTKVLESDNSCQISRETKGLTTGCNPRNAGITFKNVCEKLKGSVSKTQQKTPEGKECSEFSSDTDDYEFVFSDSEKETKTEKSARQYLAHDNFVAENTSKSPISVDNFFTEELQNDPTAHGNFVAEESRKDSIEKDVSVTETEYIKLADDDNRTASPLNLETDVSEVDSKHQSASERLTGELENLSESENLSKTNDSVKCSYSTLSQDKDSTEGNQNGSELLVGCDIDPLSKTINRTAECYETMKEKLVEERAPDGHSDQRLRCRKETLPQETGTSFTGDLDPLSAETVKEVQEDAYAGNTTSDKQQCIQKKRKKRKSELDALTETASQDLDILASESSGQNQVDSDGNELKSKENKTKKRKKRKSELENLVEMQMEETDKPGIPESERTFSETSTGDPDSGVVTSLAHVAKQYKRACEAGEKQKKKKKKKLKFCIKLAETNSTNITSEEQTKDFERISIRRVPQSPDTAISELLSVDLSTTSKNASEHLPQVEHELSRNKQSNSEHSVILNENEETNSEHSVILNENEETNAQNKQSNLECMSTFENLETSTENQENPQTSAKNKQSNSECLSVSEDQEANAKNKESNSERLSGSENQNTNTERFQDQSGEIVKEAQTSGPATEKIKKKKKKNKKLKIVFGNGQETSTREIPASVNIDSSSLNDLDRVPEHHTDFPVSNLQNMAQPDSDNRKRTASSDGAPQKKKRKKRLSELETLIHDQEAYSSQMDTIVENHAQDSEEKNGEQNIDRHTDVTQQPEITETDRSGTHPESGVTESSRSKEHKSCEGSGLETFKTSGVAAGPTSSDSTKALDSLSADIHDAASETGRAEDNVSRQQQKKDALHTVKSKVARAKKKKKLVTADVVIMPSATSDIDKDVVTVDSESKDSIENADLNCQVSKDTSRSAERDIASVKDMSSDTDNENDEERSNRAMKKFLTSRSFGKWELARMFGTPFVVLERLSDQDVYFMSRRFRNARVSSRARCSAHCRLRTLGYLCELNLINCRPPTVSLQTASELQGDTASSATDEPPEKKKRKRKSKEGSDKAAEDQKKKKKRKEHSDDKGSDGESDVIIVNDFLSETSTLVSSSQENLNLAPASKVLPSFPSATFGRIRIAQPSAQLVVSSSQLTTSAGPCLITVPPPAASRTSSVPQIFTLPPFGSASRPSSLPQVITISSLGTTVSSANKIIIPPLFVNSTTSSLRDATRASLTQAISNSLCKTRLVTARLAAPVVTTPPPPPIVSAHSASLLPKGPIVVQATVPSQSPTVVPKGPVLVQATVPQPSASVLPKGPIMVQATVASSTTPAGQVSTSTPKQFFVVQMGDKRVLVPASAISSITTTSTVLSTSVPPATTVAATSRPHIQSSVSLQQSANPAPTVISAPATGIRQQATSLIPGSMARIVLSNRRPTTVAPRTGPTASTLLFASRTGARPNQAWTGPRTVDSHRRVMVTPNSQPQGVRVVLSGAGPISSGTRFTVSSSRGGVFVTSRQPGNLVRVASPRQTRPGKRVMTEEERLRKRARLEKKYPLPPGVVIKTEPVSRGYSDEGKTTQANNSARVFVSSVPVGTGNRTQVNLTQPIPVLSAFRGSPIVIRQAVPVSSSIQRSSSLLGPLIIRMPNTTTTTNTSSTSASCASTVTAMTASSLLSSLNRASHTTTSALPLTYSLLSGNTGATAGATPSSSAAVTFSTSLASLPSQTTAELRPTVSCAPVSSVSSAPSGTSSVSSGSEGAVNSSQQNNSEDDAIYIADSPSPDAHTSETENIPDSSSQTLTTESISTALTTTAQTSCPSVTTVPVSSAPVSSVATSVVYSSQSPVMTSAVPSPSVSAPSSRMASLGAMWARQATESPDSIPSIDTRSLQSDRMQRLKDFLAKQMENMGDERRQKALQILHRQFCQTTSPTEDISDGRSQPVTEDILTTVDIASRSSEDSSVSDSNPQHTETANQASESGDYGHDTDNETAVKENERAGSGSSENLVTECRDEGNEAELHEKANEIEERLETSDMNGAESVDDDVVVLDADRGAEGTQPAMAATANTDNNCEQDISQDENVSQANSVHEPAECVSGDAVCEEQREGNKNDGSGEDTNTHTDNTSECDLNRTSDSGEGGSEDNRGPHDRSQGTPDSERDLTERTSGTDKSETGCVDISSDGSESVCVPSGIQSDSS